MNIAALIEKLQERSQDPVAEYKPYSLNDGALKGVECPICKNTGVTTKIVDGVLYSSECECMARRRAKKAARESGLQEMMDAYCFDKYLTGNKESYDVKRLAQKYTYTKGGEWLYAYGNPGSGKTHICTAICNELIEQGFKVKYVLWRELVQKLRTVINEREYWTMMNELKAADVLYIDDFLKGTITDADMNRAFEIINARYNLKSKKTIISSERSLVDVARLDPAISGRIRERSRNYTIKMPGRDWRM